MTTCLKQRITSHPGYQFWQEWSFNRFIGVEVGRESTPLRKPNKSMFSYRFKTNPHDEEHRQYKLIDGQYEEYTSIERGFYPGFAKVKLKVHLVFLILTFHHQILLIPFVSFLFKDNVVCNTFI